MRQRNKTARKMPGYSQTRRSETKHPYTGGERGFQNEIGRAQRRSKDEVQEEIKTKLHGMRDLVIGESKLREGVRRNSRSESAKKVRL